MGVIMQFLFFFLLERFEFLLRHRSPARTVLAGRARVAACSAPATRRAGQHAWRPVMARDNDITDDSGATRTGSTRDDRITTDGTRDDRTMDDRTMTDGTRDDRTMVTDGTRHQTTAAGTTTDTMHNDRAVRA